MLFAVGVAVLSVGGEESSVRFEVVLLWRLGVRAGGREIREVAFIRSRVFVRDRGWRIRCSGGKGRRGGGVVRRELLCVVVITNN